MTKTRDIAIFDLDYTLTQRGTWGRFVWQVVKFRPWVWLPLLVSAGLTQWRYKQGKLPRIRVKQAMLRWAMAGKDRAKLTKIAHDFALSEVETGLRPGAIEALNRHKASGDILIIISAAVDIIVEPMANALGFDHWLATNMGWENGKVSTEFSSPNCYGPEKVTRFQALLDAKPELKQTDTVITFYTDSHSDIELLSFCDVAIAVNPSSKLQAVAEQRGWKIVDWT